MKYRVTQRSGVYDDVVVEVDFPVDLDNPIHRMVVMAYAIEEMYGCPISDVSGKHVCDMLESLTISVDE